MHAQKKMKHPWERIVDPSGIHSGSIATKLCSFPSQPPPFPPSACSVPLASTPLVPCTITIWTLRWLVPAGSAFPARGVYSGGDPGKPEVFFFLIFLGTLTVYEKYKEKRIQWSDGKKTPPLYMENTRKNVYSGRTAKFSVYGQNTRKNVYS